MNHQALAEQMTDLYLQIQDYYEKKTSNSPITDQLNTIFIECSKMLITETIGKQRQGVPTQQKRESDQIPSEKQISFATKLGCHNPEGFSKKELSAWIEEHKEW